MARARNIKPGFFESEQVGSLPIPARVLFVALWQLADREGRLVERPMQIRAYAFRYDSVTVEEVASWLVAMEAGKLIERYEADGLKLIEITNFVKHQRPHVKEPQSELSGKSTGEPGKVRAFSHETQFHEEKPGKNRAFFHETAFHEEKPGKVRAEWPYMGVEPALNVECGMLNVECGRGNAALPAPPPPANSETDPGELFQQAAKFACEQLPAGGDLHLTIAAMQAEFQKSASFDGNPAGFCLSFTARVRKWRAAYDINPDLRTKAAQWWTRDGTYAQEPPKARAPRQFGPVDLKAGEDADGL